MVIKMFFDIVLIMLFYLIVFNLLINFLCLIVIKKWLNYFIFFIIVVKINENRGSGLNDLFIWIWRVYFRIFRNRCDKI